MRRAVTGVVVVAVLLVLAGAGYRWYARSHQSRLAQAVAGAPSGVERLSWTDWAGVRRELGLSLSARSTAGELADFLDQGYVADLTSTSALVQSAAVLQDRFGFSPATAEWELFSQGADGAVVALRLRTTPTSTRSVTGSTSSATRARPMTPGAPGCGPAAPMSCRRSRRT